MKVTKYMSTKLVTTTPDTGIRTAFFTMRRKGIRHLPVVDHDTRLLGMISDRDLRRPDWVDEAPDLSHMYNLDDSIEVRNMMTGNPIVVHTYDKVHKANALLIKHNFGALPVLDKDERLAGILSAMDLLRVLDEVLHERHRRS